jgi:hypothetical protein
MTPDEPHWVEAGDPTILGWFISALYVLAGLLALRAWWKYRSSGGDVQSLLPAAAGLQRLATWWLVVAVLMILLGLTKELDLLQKMVRVWGRAAVANHGWYANRAIVQRAFVALMALVLAGAGGVVLYYFRSILARIIPALAGMALVLLYALLQTAAFNGFRDAMPTNFDAVVWLLEPAGVLLVLWCAIHATAPAARS